MFEKLKKNSKILFFLAAAVIAIPGIIGLIHLGFPLTDDGNWMVIRFSAFYEALRNGQFPVRFLFRLNNGFGYPVADFLYPLFMYIGVPIHIFGFSFVNTIKIILALSLIFSSVFTFLWLRKLFDNLSSLVGSIFYTFFPYHLFDLYKRGSVGEMLSLSILPFIFWQFERKSLAWSTIGIVLLILSHNTLAVLFLPLIFLYMVLDIVILKDRGGFFRHYFGVLALSLGLSAFFWIPAIFDLQYTVFFETKVSNLNNYFSDLTLVGLSTIIVIFLTFIFMASEKIKIKKHRLAVSLLIVGIISIFFASPISISVWKFLPVSFIQFPFRFLSLAILCFSFLAACIVSVLSGKKKVIMAGLILIVTLFSARPYLLPGSYQNYSDSFYSTNQDSTTVKNEYMPKWVKQIPAAMPNEKITVLKEQGSIQSLFVNGNKVTFSINALNDTQVQFNTVYFPGWKVKVDGKEIPVSYSNDNGLIRFLINSGKHNVNISFGETPLRMASDLISLVSLIAFFVFIIKDRRTLFK